MGGSSHVYRGHLKDGASVAIKRMKAVGGPDVQSDFLTEVLQQNAKISQILVKQFRCFLSWYYF